jgi:hypothetical protein
MDLGRYRGVLVKIDPAEICQRGHIARRAHVTMLVVGKPVNASVLLVVGHIAGDSYDAAKIGKQLLCDLIMGPCWFEVVEHKVNGVTMRSIDCKGPSQ